MIVQFTDDIPIINTERFNTYGSKLIRESRRKSPIIVMDECGLLESHALEFQSEVLDCLNGDIPVLGIIRQTKRPAWLDQIKRHQNVETLLVNHANRDQLAKDILRKLPI